MADVEPKYFEKLFFDERTKIPKTMRLFVVTKNNYLYVNNGAVRTSARTGGIMGGLTRIERGKILSRFAEFEFLINEFLRYAVGGHHKNQRLIDIIVRHPINQKISFLESWKLITKDLAKSLRRIFKVRDGFAHKFDEKETMYREKPIADSFSEFVRDIQSVWESLILDYNKIIKINILEICQELEDCTNGK